MLLEFRGSDIDCRYHGIPVTPPEILVTHRMPFLLVNGRACIDKGGLHKNAINSQQRPKADRPHLLTLRLLWLRYRLNAFSFLQRELSDAGNSFPATSDQAPFLSENFTSALETLTFFVLFCPLNL